MKADPILKGLDDVGKKWTRQIKAEERHESARLYRHTAWSAPARVPLRDICWRHMEQAWEKASGCGRLPTHWRQVFYVMRPLCDSHADSDRPLRDTTFKQILEDYLQTEAPGWDVLRGARGVFKEPHRAADDNGLAMSTMNVRRYLATPPPSAQPGELPRRFPTQGARNRIAAVLICEKEGFDELLEKEQVTDRFDLALCSTKGISAIAARDLNRALGIPCFTLHDLDKNGFVMSAGFPFATDLGIRLSDVEELGLDPEPQRHKNPQKTFWNLRDNGATREEAQFISDGQRVELNMLTGPQFIQYVEEKLDEYGVEKVVPERDTLEVAWRRAIRVGRINAFIRGDEQVIDPNASIPSAPDDLGDRIREGFEEDDTQSWDEVLWDLAEEDGEA